MEHTPSPEDHTDPTTDAAPASDDHPASDHTGRDEAADQSVEASANTPEEPHDTDSLAGDSSLGSSGFDPSDDEILAAAGMGPTAAVTGVDDCDASAGASRDRSNHESRRNAGKAGSSGKYRRWRRPTDDRLVAGVAAAISDGAGLPLWFVRTAFAVAALFGGLGIAAYLGAWAIMPSGDATHSLSDRWRERWDAAERPSERAGLVLMAAAVLLAISATGVVAGPMTLAVVLVLVGIAMLQPESI